MNVFDLLLILAGFAVLLTGAEFLVRGSSQLAIDLGISPLVVGLTVVAFGTSAPELAVSLLSAWRGQAGIALGNAVGSNICNILLILGLSALAAPLVVSRQVVRLEVPIMIAVSILLFLFSLDGTLQRWEGVLFFAGVIVYTAWSIRRSRREVWAQRAKAEVDLPPRGRRGLELLQIAGGLVGLTFGSRWLVDGAVSIARHFGVSDMVIGLTLIALGTSLPELATSILASLRGQRDMAVGNVIGSNIFNILVVLGLTAAVAPGGVPVPPAALAFDLPVMVAVAVACLPVFLVGHRIDRWEGGLFFGYYLAYLLLVVMASTGHPALGPFTRAMLFFILPLTSVTVLVSLYRHFRQLNRR